MPKDTQLPERIDRLVHAIRNDGWNNGFNTSDDPWKKQILELFKELAESVIGAEEPNKHPWRDLAKNEKVYIRNTLRAEQKAHLEQLIKGE